MMRFFLPARILIYSAGIATCCVGAEQVQAQLVPAIKTRRFEPAFQYSPTDPWTRSKAIQVQTKHYGFFYNCDGEECKRNSPFIKWKGHCETDLPKQRISDGGCGCGEPGCSCQ